MRSVLVTESLIFAATVDASVLLRHDLQAILQQELPILVLRDSCSLFSVVVKSTTTMEKSQIMVLRAAQEAFDRRDMKETGSIRRELNLDEGLPKYKSSSLLTTFLHNHFSDRVVLRWIVR